MSIYRFLAAACMVIPLFFGAAACAQDTDIPFNVNEANRTLDKIAQKLSKEPIAREESDAFISTLNMLQTQTLNAQKEDNAQLAAVTQKINALGSIDDTKGKEVPALAKQRKSFEDSANKFKVQLAQETLILTKIDEINSLILKTRNQELLTSVLAKQSSIFQPTEFYKSLLSFWLFMKDILLSPAAWYRQLTPQQQNDAQHSLGILTLMLGAALILAVLIRNFIKKHFWYDFNTSNPSYMQKFKAATAVFVMRGAIPAAIIGVFWGWMNGFDLMGNSNFAMFLKNFALYLLYFMVFRAAILSTFAPRDPDWRIFEIEKHKVIPGSRALIFAAAAVAAVSFLQNLAAAMNHDTEIVYSMQIFANGIKAFAVIWAVLQLMYDANDLSDEDVENGNIQKLSASSQAAVFIALFMVISFAAALFGYIRLSEYLINHFIISAAIIGILYILNNLLKILYHQLLRRRFWITLFRINPRTLVKSEVWFGIILTPVIYLFGALVLLAAWGVSVDILVAKTKGFLTGFNIGEVRVSITSIILGLASFWVAMVFVKMLKSSLQNGNLSRLDFDDGMKNSILSGISFFGFIFSVILGIAVMGGSFKSIAIMAGALSFGAGLGLQNIVSNLVAGITILFERPVKVGDWVVINGYEGVVKQISMRATTLESWDKSNVIIPNSAIIAGSVVNKTYDNRMARIAIKVGVDYGSDIAKVKEILLKIAADDPDILKNPSPSLAFLEFADSSLDFQLNCYTANIFNSSGISFRLRENIINSFRKEGINIPFPQRVVRSLEDLSAAAD